MQGEGSGPLSDIEEREVTPAELGLDGEVLAHFAARVGPLAVVDLETTGLMEDPEAGILELGVLLIDSDPSTVRTLSALVKPTVALPRVVKRLTGLTDADVEDAPPVASVAPAFAKALDGRTIIAHNAEFERSFLSRQLHSGLADAHYLDTLDLLALTHPDAPDLRLESFTRMLMGTEEKHRALDDALDTARVMSLAGRGALRGELRYATARRALEAYAPESPWLGLLQKPQSVDLDTREESLAFVSIGETDEKRVPFDEDAIAEALADEARGKRNFPGYRVRPEQIELARRFARNLADDEVLLIEGGTGVGKSLAYLAAAIPFALEKGDGMPVVVSTRTKLLQDQLLDRDIAATARFLGYPDLEALSIKGRANYACARRLTVALAEGREQSIFPEDRLAYAVLETCARTRRHGEIGAVPAALLRRYGPLRDLLRRSVAARADQCSREQCAKERDCPFGRRRKALSKAHLVIANHDLLLRWPPDYPAFQHVIADEAHELADVADEAYALEVRPESLLERLDEIFGRPIGPRQRKGDSLLARAARSRLDRDSRAWRRELDQELKALGRAVAELAGEWGEVQIPEQPGAEFAAASKIAAAAADRLDAIADRVPMEEEPDPALERAVEDLRQSAHGLRLAFDESEPDSVSAFEAVLPPFDRWRLVVRQVSPAGPFHVGLMESLHSFAGVSASLFMDGNAFAALGELGLEERAGERLQTVSVPSPFPYEKHMRVVAMRGGQDLVSETALVLELLAKQLGGRCLGLFTSLRRMNEVGDELVARLRPEGIEVITPRRGSDDPSALVSRFVNGSAVLLGARRFWQGIDIPGDALQAVVIEKLPFEVPTELRRRREQRLKERGISPFQKSSLGKMLLNLKQMSGRLIRSEEDRGIVVIVEGRSEKRYFNRLNDALPPGCEVRVVQSSELISVLAEVGLPAED